MPRVDMVVMPLYYSGTDGRLRSRALRVLRRVVACPSLLARERVLVSLRLNPGSPQLLLPELRLLVEVEEHSGARQLLVEGQLST